MSGTMPGVTYQRTIYNYARGFDYFWDTKISGVGAPYEVGASLWEILDPSLQIYILTVSFIHSSAWLWDQTSRDGFIPGISKRIEMITGLTTQYREVFSSAEPFQVYDTLRG